MATVFMRARYAGTCARCGRRIAAGEMIDFDRGARKAYCGGGQCDPEPARLPVRQAALPSAARATLPITRARALQPGEQEVTRPSAGRDDRYVVGETRHMARVGGGGGPDGHYWTVVAEGKRQISQYEDDTREGEWVCWAHVRPATAEEAAPVAARVIESEARKARAAEVASVLRSSYSAESRAESRPADCTELWGDHRMAGSEAWYQAPDGSVWFVRSDYDMGETTWHTTAAPDLVAEAKALGLRPGL